MHNKYVTKTCYHFSSAFIAERYFSFLAFFLGVVAAFRESSVEVS